MRGYTCLNIKRHHSVNQGFFAGEDNSRLFTSRQLGQVENYFSMVGTLCTCLTWPNLALSLQHGGARGIRDPR